jgi:hypothetical protein
MRWSLTRAGARVHHLSLGLALLTNCARSSAQAPESCGMVIGLVAIARLRVFSKSYGWRCWKSEEKG